MLNFFVTKVKFGMLLELNSAEFQTHGYLMKQFVNILGCKSLFRITAYTLKEMLPISSKFPVSFRPVYTVRSSGYKLDDT